MRKMRNLQRLLLGLLMMLFFGCRTVMVREVTRTVVPDYTFPAIPEFPMDVEELPNGRYSIDGEYFKSLDVYFVLIEALEKEYEIDKKLYTTETTGEWYEHRKDY